MSLSLIPPTSAFLGPIRSLMPPSIKNHTQAAIRHACVGFPAFLVGRAIGAAALESALAAVVGPLRDVPAQVINQVVVVAPAASLADLLDKRAVAQLAQLRAQGRGILGADRVAGPGVQGVLSGLRAVIQLLRLRGGGQSIAPARAPAQPLTVRL